MPGLIIDFPAGDDWEYSLDNSTWQASPRFLAQTDGTPFEVGQEYPIYCRNTAQNKTAMETVIFGKDDNGIESRMTLQKVIFNDPVATSVPEFTGGILGVLPEEPADARYGIVTADADGLFHLRPMPAIPIANFIIDGHYIEREGDRLRAVVINSEWQGTVAATVKPGVLRVVGADTFVSGTSEDYNAQEQLTNDEWRSYSGPPGSGVFHINSFPGLAINAETGVLTGSQDQDLNNMQVFFTAGGYTASKSVNVKSNVLSILQGNYSFLKNNPPVSAPELYFNVLISKAATLEVSMEVTDYTGQKQPNNSGFTPMEQNKTVALRRNGSLYNAPIDGYVELTIREVGKTAILLKITLPKLPNGNVPSSQFFPVNT